MVTKTGFDSDRDVAPPPNLGDDLPILYEDDEEGELGESSPHVSADEILHICLLAHFAGRSEYKVFSNMNLYYQPGPSQRVSRLPYVSPDTMVVVPFHPLGDDVTSYQIGKDGPAPELTIEVLSERSAQQRDLVEKLTVYAKLGVKEYFLVDPSGRFLAQKLLLKRLQPDKTWSDEQDDDGGLSSAFGFRLTLDSAGRVQVQDAATGRAYVRPTEAEQRVRDLEAEVARLRQALEKKS
ncbi:MAG TPA: Uma2 family endonuclease [Gemmataceae bacterium]|nr:Uma2 family endonuclease [Gemmataceae bacterium]